MKQVYKYKPSEYQEQIKINDEDIVSPILDINEGLTTLEAGSYVVKDLLL